MTTTIERDFTSVGQLAAHTQRPVRRIEAAAAELGLIPALRLNGICYFDGEQIEKLTAHLTQKET